MARTTITDLPLEILQIGEDVGDTRTLANLCKTSRSLNTVFNHSLYEHEAHKEENLLGPYHVWHNYHVPGVFTADGTDHVAQENDRSMAPAMLWAVANGKFGHIDFLLNRGLDINKDDSVRYRVTRHRSTTDVERVFFYGSALAWACLLLSTKDVIGMINFLLARGADPNTGGAGNFFRFLRSYGLAEAKLRPGVWCPALHTGQGWTCAAIAIMACWNRDPTPVVSEFLEWGARPYGAWRWNHTCRCQGHEDRSNLSHDQFISVLGYAAAFGRVRCIEHIAHKHPRLVNEPDFYYLTPIHWAAMGQAPGTAVPCLIRLGVHVNPVAGVAFKQWSVLHFLANNIFDEAGIATRSVIRAGGNVLYLAGQHYNNPRAPPMSHAFSVCATKGYPDPRLLAYVEADAGHMVASTQQKLLVQLDEIMMGRRLAWGDHTLRLLLDATKRLAQAGRPLGRACLDDSIIEPARWRTRAHSFEYLFKHLPIETTNKQSWYKRRGGQEFVPNMFYEADDIGLYWRPRMARVEKWWLIGVHGLVEKEAAVRDPHLNPPWRELDMHARKKPLAADILASSSGKKLRRVLKLHEWSLDVASYDIDLVF